VGVGGEQVDGVGLEAQRLRREVLAARVGRDDPKTRRRQRLDLEPPTEPEVREAVQQNDQRPVTGLDVMQALIADLGVTLPKLDPEVRELVVVMKTSLGKDLGSRLRLPIAATQPPKSGDIRNTRAAEAPAAFSDGSRLTSPPSSAGFSRRT
jgi:hypothetical protein